MSDLLKGFTLGKKRLIKNNTSKAFLFRIIIKYKMYVILLIVFAMINSFISVFPNELIRLSVNSAIDSNVKMVLKYTTIYFILLIFGDVINSIFNYINDYSNQKISNFVQMNSYKHILKLDYKEIENFNSADILTREINSIDAITTLITQAANLIVTIFSGIWVFILAFRIDPFITFLMFVLVEPIRLKLSQFIAKNLKHKVEIEQQCRSKVNKTLLETVCSLREIKLFNMQKIQCEKLDEEHLGLLSKVKQLSKFRYTTGFLNLFIYNAVMFVVLLRACILVLNKSIGAGDVMILITYFNIYQMRVNIMFRMISNFQASLVKIDRSLALLLKKEEIYKDSKLNSINQNEDFTISFKDISFSYNNNDKVLENLNLDIGKNEKIGIIGESGAGKTTLIKLLSMLYTDYCGEIKINNINIKNYSLLDLRNIVSIVPQDPLFFDDTIKNNILMGLEDIPINEIEKVCKLVNAHDFIKAFSNKYETMVGEKGCKLSGGQKQRIALARCLIRNPKIVILDEPTSALDKLNQEKIIKELLNILKDKTTIIISHQSEVMNLVNDIYKLENGELTKLKKSKI